MGIAPRQGMRHNCLSSSEAIISALNGYVDFSQKDFRILRRAFAKMPQQVWCQTSSLSTPGTPTPSKPCQDQTNFLCRATSIRFFCSNLDIC